MEERLFEGVLTCAQLAAQHSLGATESMSTSHQAGGSRRVLFLAVDNGCGLQRPACVEEHSFGGVSPGWCAACLSMIKALSKGAHPPPVREDSVLAVLSVAAGDGCDGFDG